MKSCLGNWVLGAILVSTMARGVRAETYTIDGSHAAIIFGVSHLGYSFTYGRFNKMKGAYVLDRANPAASSFQLAIDAASIDTNSADRDKHLRGPDFFNTNQYPLINFQSTRVSLEQTDRGAVYNITGNLTMHGVTRQVTLPMRLLGEGKGPYGNYRTGFYGTSRIRRSEFGMTNMSQMIGDDVAITISFEGLRQGAAEGSGSAGSAGSGSAGRGAGSSGKKGSAAR